MSIASNEFQMSEQDFAPTFPNLAIREVGVSMLRARLADDKASHCWNITDSQEDEERTKFTVTLKSHREDLERVRGRISTIMGGVIQSLAKDYPQEVKRGQTPR